MMGLRITIVGRIRGISSVALGLLVFGLSPDTTRGRTDASLTIRLVSTVENAHEVDRAPKGRVSKGDTAYVRSVLRNAIPQFGKPKGAVVGSDYAVFTVLSPPRALVKIQVRLPGGTLRVRGRVRVGQTRGELAVRGGTGRFANARGTSEVRDLLDRSINIYRLRLP